MKKVIIPAVSNYFLFKNINIMKVAREKEKKILQDLLDISIFD